MGSSVPQYKHSLWHADFAWALVNVAVHGGKNLPVHLPGSGRSPYI